MLSVSSLLLPPDKPKAARCSADVFRRGNSLWQNLHGQAREHLIWGAAEEDRNAPSSHPAPNTPHPGSKQRGPGGGLSDVSRLAAPSPLSIDRSRVSSRRSRPVRAQQCRPFPRNSAAPTPKLLLPTTFRRSNIIVNTVPSPQCFEARKLYFLLVSARVGVPGCPTPWRGELWAQWQLKTEMPPAESLSWCKRPRSLFGRAQVQMRICTA